MNDIILRELCTCFSCRNILLHPRMLPCGHSFCLECLLSQVENNNPSCTSCEKAFPDPWQLPINHQLQTIASYVRQSSPPQSKIISTPSRMLNLQLISASEKNSVDDVKTLLQAGADPNTRGSTGDTAVHNACRQKDSKMLKILLAATDYF